MGGSDITGRANNGLFSDAYMNFGVTGSNIGSAFMPICFIFKMQRNANKWNVINRLLNGGLIVCYLSSC